MRNHITYILTIFLLISCTGMEEGDGYVRLGINENIAAPLAMEVKSASEIEVTQEQIDAFDLWVEGTKIAGTYASIKDETFKLRTGTYTAFAQNCSDEYAEANPDIYGCVRYYGSTEFDVETLKTTQDVEIICSIANARVAVALTEDFTSYFNQELTSVRISDIQDFSSRSLQMITGGAQTLADGIRTAYFTAGDAVYAEVTTRKKGADRNVTYKVKAIPSAQSNTSYTISLMVDEASTTGGITFTINGSDLTTNDFISIESYTPVADFIQDPLVGSEE